VASTHRFGERRIYYNNFAAHLLNAYNPNMLYPGLPHRWTTREWRQVLRMVASFGFNAFSFWLVPRLFSRDAFYAEFGRAFIRQIKEIIEEAHELGLQVGILCSLTTVGSEWHTHCPAVPEEWAEVRELWDAWTRTLSGLDMVSIFPGDPGGCSRNGCTAETFIDRAVEIAHLIKENLPQVEIELNTWGPPFFGWGIIEGPEGWEGEFLPEYQQTAWRFIPERAKRSMEHLLKRLPDFPEPTVVAINLGFNPDGNPVGEESAVPWAREIAKTHSIRTWDFSLTEGENAILPHWRFERLFARRREERAAAPYSGGICFTMTPLLNQLSLYEAAQSFLFPEADPFALAEGFYERLFGPAGREIVPFLPLFEVVPDWGNYQKLEISREDFCRKMNQLAELLEDLRGTERENLAFHPLPERYRQELLFFAQLFARLSGPNPDYDALAREYWQRVYSIWDFLPEHVDPRPRKAVANLIAYFQRMH